MEEFPLDFLCLGPFEPEKPLQVSTPSTQLLEIVLEVELILGFTIIGRLVVSVEEGNLIVNVVSILWPPLRVTLAVPFMVHVVNHIHFCRHYIQMNYSSCAGKVAEAIGKEQGSRGVLIIIREMLRHILTFVIFVVAENIRQHEMLLIRGHVEVDDAQSHGY